MLVSTHQVDVNVPSLRSCLVFKIFLDFLSHEILKFFGFLITCIVICKTMEFLGHMNCNL